MSWTFKNIASCASSIMAPGSRCAMPPSVGSARLPLLFSPSATGYRLHRPENPGPRPVSPQPPCRFPLLSHGIPVFALFSLKDCITSTSTNLSKPICSPIIPWTDFAVTSSLSPHLLPQLAHPFLLNSLHRSTETPTRPVLQLNRTQPPSPPTQPTLPDLSFTCTVSVFLPH